MLIVLSILLSTKEREAVKMQITRYVKFCQIKDFLMHFSEKTWVNLDPDQSEGWKDVKQILFDKKIHMKTKISLMKIDTHHSKTQQPAILMAICEDEV